MAVQRKDAPNVKYGEIRSLVRAKIDWAKEIYVASKRTYQADSRRVCWICEGKFKIGQGVTLCFTNFGNKIVHSTCYEEQANE